MEDFAEQAIKVPEKVANVLWVALGAGVTMLFNQVAHKAVEIGAERVRKAFKDGDARKEEAAKAVKKEEK